MKYVLLPVMMSVLSSCARSVYCSFGNAMVVRQADPVITAFCMTKGLLCTSKTGAPELYLVYIGVPELRVLWQNLSSVTVAPYKVKFPQPSFYALHLTLNISFDYLAPSRHL